MSLARIRYHASLLADYQSWAAAIALSRVDICTLPGSVLSRATTAFRLEDNHREVISLVLDLRHLVRNSG